MAENVAKYDDKHNSSATPVFALHHPRFPLKNQASGVLSLWRGVFCLFLYIISLKEKLGKRGVGTKNPALQTVSCRKVKCAAEEINIAAGRGGAAVKIEITAAGWEEGGDGWPRSRSRSLPASGWETRGRGTPSKPSAVILGTTGPRIGSKAG